MDQSAKQREEPSHAHIVVLGCVLGGLTSVAVMGITYVGNQVGPLGFPPFVFFDFLSRVLPGVIITAAIDLLVSSIERLELGATSSTAKAIEQGLSLLLFIGIGLLFGGILGALRKRVGSERLAFYGLSLGIVLAIIFAVMEARVGFSAAGAVGSLAWNVVVFGVWGLVLGWLLHTTTREPLSESTVAGLSRREVLSIGGTSLVAAIAAIVGIGFIVRGREPSQRVQTAPTPRSAQTSGAAASPPKDILEARIEPAPGTRPEITPTDEFYRIDINTQAPAIDVATWQLEIGGLVNNPMRLSLEELRQRPSISQYLTLSCISNYVGGDLIGTTLWTGTRLNELMEEAGLQEEVKSLRIEADDGFFETVVMEDLLDDRTLLVYEMDGEPLPQEHGFPLRIYIPNRYGMKQPKWIERITAVADEPRGYWVERGWSETAVMLTTSAIDEVTTETNSDGMTIMGGIAHAGERGISKVEVQVDSSEWREAELRVPPLSPLTWVQWRYENSYPPGEHIARVRAYDGDGDLQIADESFPHPRGATGIHEFPFES